MNLESITTGVTFEPPRIMIYGQEGIGKSTFAAGAPDPIFIPTETGLNTINTSKFPVCKNVTQVFAAVNELINKDHTFKTVVIDSLDWFEKLVFDDICFKYNVKNIEQVDKGYGRGYRYAQAYHWQLISMLDTLRTNKNMTVIFVAHAKVERFEDPTSLSYDRYTPKLQQLANKIYIEWCDVVAFAGWRLVLEEDEHRSRHIATAINKPGDDRSLRVSGSPSCVAKNRYGLYGELPLNWSSLASKIYPK